MAGATFVYTSLNSMLFSEPSLLPQLRTFESPQALAVSPIGALWGNTGQQGLEGFCFSGDRTPGDTKRAADSDGAERKLSSPGNRQNIEGLVLKGDQWREAGQPNAGTARKRVMQGGSGLPGRVHRRRTGRARCGPSMYQAKESMERSGGDHPTLFFVVARTYVLQ